MCAFLGFRGGPPGLVGHTCHCAPSLASGGRPTAVDRKTGGEAEEAGREERDTGGKEGIVVVVVVVAVVVVGEIGQ